jgi:hypothetical protein
LADEALTIDFGWMLRKGFAAPGAFKSGQLHWRCRGEPSGWIFYSCDMTDDSDALLTLRFDVADKQSDEKHSYIQHISLVCTVPTYGGRRWWMLCPENGSRILKLYCPRGAHTFASRTAWRLAYRSQRLQKRDRPFEALFRVQRRLGCLEGLEQPIRRPKGMWRRTFKRHVERYDELDAACSSVVAEFEEALRQMDGGGRNL